MSPSIPAPGELNTLRGCLFEAGFRSLDDPGVRHTPLNRIRRSGRSREEDTVRTLTLVERDGVLYWEEEDVAEAPAAGFRGLGLGRRVRGAVLDRFVLPVEQPLEPSQVYSRLTDLDKGFNHQWGLKQWDGKDLNPIPTAPNGGPLLLFVHGTFSDASSLFDELTATADGKAFLKAAKQHYKAILAFDHPTLSVSPMLNALDLARLFQTAAGPVDVISRSRGGLVTRWWLEALDRGPRNSRRAALVGSPLNGTSLAAPAYFLVKSNFEPKGLGWKFWEVFVDLKDRAKDATADAIFREPNDLVVDTASMTDIQTGFTPRPGSVYGFGTTNSVHHTNYFRQAKTLKFLRESFGF